MKNPIEHERMRFKTMTQEQLLTRLRKITHPEKLESFVVIAREYGYNLLVKIATEKITQSGGQAIVPPRPFLNPVKSPQPMTKEQSLLGWLKKITDPEQLEFFIIRAKEDQYPNLVRIATEKLNQLRNQTKKDLKPVKKEQTTNKRSLVF